MGENLSIFEKEKFAECSLCNTLVSSLNPTCRNCGLEMSSEGIIAIAEENEIENESNGFDFSDIHNLRFWAMLSIAYTIFGYIFYLGLESAFFFKLYFWLGLFIYFSVYTNWSKKFPTKTLSYEDLELVKKEKTISLLIFFSSTILGAIIYIFLLK